MNGPSFKSSAKKTYRPLQAPFSVPLALLALAWGWASLGAPPPTEWGSEQHLVAPAPGLVKLSLPLTTLEASRSGLEDLRLYDAAWNETPYLLEQPRPAAKVTREPKSFRLALTATNSVATLETGLAEPLDAVELETFNTNFIKGVQVDGSSNGRQWQTLAQGQPVFWERGGPSQLRVALPPGPWAWLRLTMDDQRSPPVAFIGARLQARAGESIPTENLAVRINGRHENPGESRLRLELGAANVDLATLEIETAEPLFSRQVSVAAPQVTEEGIREQSLGDGVIYRVGVVGQPPVSNITVQVQGRVSARELFLLVRNQDSPPLPIAGVRAERRPVYLVFNARAPGLFHLLTGNRRCAAPSYDLAALGSNLKTVPVSPLEISALVDNPNRRAPEVLPGLPQGGPPLDVSAWKFRKEVRLTGAGPQQLDLDLDVLAHANPAFSDLRLVRAGRQWPFLFQRTSISRSIIPLITAAQDPGNPRVGRWLFHLPRAGLPVARLICTARTRLFQRWMMLFEEQSDYRGETYRRPLAAGNWVRTPDHTADFELALDNLPLGDMLILETDNGDNPAIELDKFEFFCPVTRLVFKAQAGEPLYLCYGNPRAAMPRYDLSLVARELLAADKLEAGLGPEELVQRPSWWEFQTAGRAGLLFWGVLALVVLGLLVLIARLLPKRR